MKEVKNVKVKLISIVTGKYKPKNGESALIKSDDAIVIKADSVDKLKGLMYVTVMKANSVDSDDEYYNPETVRKAAHDFLGSNIENPTDENHDLQEKAGVKVVESYYDESETAWKAVIDISGDTELMQKAEAGEIHGVSIYGVGTIIEKAAGEKKNLFTKAKEYIDKKLNNISKGEIKMSDKETISKAEIAEMVKAGVNAVLKEKEEAANLEKAQNAKDEKIANLEKDIEELKKAVVKPQGSKDEGKDQEIKKGEVDYFAGMVNVSEGE